MNDVTLREHIEKILEERDKAQQATFQATLREASHKAKEIERRMDSLNELRQEVLTDRAGFVTRTEVDLKLQGLMDKFQSLSNEVGALRQWQAKMIGGGSILILVVGFVSTVISIVVSIWAKG
jgi:hypothetical protein